ncbi:unnamed protein product [Ectocarpus sp. 4 AP-2014]
MVQTDREALVALYGVTGGANWTNNENWITIDDLSQWHGVRINDDGRVVRLQLFSNNLRGPIPEEIGTLSELRLLFLYDNILTGFIPETLGDLSNLEGLNVSNNNLKGPIPKELGNLTKLEGIDVHSNKLTGRIPEELGNLTNLEMLSVHHNELTGPIPKEMGNLTKLVILSLNNNELSGRMPKELGALTRLTNLDLSRNKLSGTIPKELGNLTALKLLGLRLNGLGGPIPPELTNLGNLQHLHLSENQLTGTIPKELGNLAALVTLWLLRNRLKGPIPPELGNLENLQQLCLSQNQITGPIPKELGNLTSLVVLLLDSNELEGPIPPELVNLGILYQCNLSSNRLKGIIPKDLVARLGQMLQVDGNQLTVDWDKSPVTDGGGWENRLEPYSNISIIATLLAGFGLAIFPLPRSDVPEGHDFVLGLTGHVVYNFLMCCSFSTNVLVTVVLTLQLYFTQRLAALHSPTVAERFMRTTQGIRHLTVCSFFFFSLPAFMIAFAVLLFTVLEEAAAICTSVVTLIGLGLVGGSTSYYFRAFKNVVHTTVQMTRPSANLTAAQAAEWQAAQVLPCSAVPFNLRF